MVVLGLRQSHQLISDRTTLVKDVRNNRRHRVRLMENRRRGGRVAEGGGLLNLPRICRFNLLNHLHVGAGALKLANVVSFG